LQCILNFCYSSNATMRASLFRTFGIFALSGGICKHHLPKSPYLTPPPHIFLHIQQETSMQLFLGIDFSGLQE